MLAVQAAETLFLTVGALGDEPVKRRSIARRQDAGQEQDFSPRLDSTRTHERFWSLSCSWRRKRQGHAR